MGKFLKIMSFLIIYRGEKGRKVPVLVRSRILGQLPGEKFQKKHAAMGFHKPLVVKGISFIQL